MTSLAKKNAPNVSAIIVNYNGLRFLDECLTSLANAFTAYDLEIIVVDNASTDSSQDWLRKRKGITYVESAVNTGFTGGNNLGADVAKGEILLFINNDTRVETKLDPMIALLERKEIGISACRLQYGDKRQQFSIGYEHTPLRIALSWLGTEKIHQLPSIFRRVETSPSAYLKTQENVNWVSGACFAMRKTEWKKLQGFDTSFFMYCEDVDLCRRVRELGYSISYTAASLVTHYEGAGKAWIGTTALKRTVQSYQIFTSKHYGDFHTSVLSCVLGVVFFARSIAFLALKFSDASKKTIYEEKSRGFKEAAITLLFTRPKTVRQGRGA